MDPMAEKYSSLSPYEYVGGNPIIRVDPDGMDWYNNDESGNLHWYDGNYADEELETPDGFSHLGGDDFFGETGSDVIGIKQKEYLAENEGNDFTDFELDAETSESMANFAGFDKAISEEEVLISEMTIFNTNARGKPEFRTEPPRNLKSINLSFTYVEKGKRIQNTDREYLYNVDINPGPAYMIEQNVERWTYDYNAKDRTHVQNRTILFVIETIGDIMSIMR